MVRRVPVRSNETPLLSTALLHQGSANMRSNNEKKSHNNSQLIPSIASLASPSRRWMVVSAVLGTYLFFDLVVFNSLKSSSDCLISFGAYKGTVYTSTETVGKPKCLLESKWMRVQQHHVQLAGMADVISDWLWIDYHDRINVLVEAPNTFHGMTGQREFMVFQQAKYALEGRTSLAIIGGIIEPGEDPKVAAVREVKEEMGIECRDLIPLGRYRTDVNRGMGWVNSFVAVNCRDVSGVDTIKDDADIVGATDMERQSIKQLTSKELRDALRKGDFLEVQWSNTVALALLNEALAEK